MNKRDLFFTYLVLFAPSDKIINAMIETYCPKELGFRNSFPKGCREGRDCEECWLDAIKTTKGEKIDV